MLEAVARRAPVRPPGRKAASPGDGRRPRDGSPEVDRLAISEEAKQALARVPERETSPGTVEDPVRASGRQEPRDPDSARAQADPRGGGARSASSAERDLDGRGSEIDAELTDTDATVGLRFGERVRFSGRVIHSSPTMMQGAGLIKLDYDLTSRVTAFAGAGHLPGFFRNTIGLNQSVVTPHSVAFAGVEAAGGKHFDLGAGFQADFGLHSLAVATLAYNHDLSKLDMNTSAGLSKATVSGEVGLSRRFGEDLLAHVGYGNWLDLGMIGAYYVTGGRGFFPQSHFLQAGITRQAGPLTYQAEAYLPLASATSDLSAEPRIRVSAGARAVPWLPDVALTGSPRGLDGVELRKSWNITGSLDGSAYMAADRPFEQDRSLRAGIGLRHAFGGRPRPRPATSPGPDWRAEPSRRRHLGPAAFTASPRLADFFSPAEIRAMRGKSVEELAKILRTPEQVVAYLHEFVRYDHDRLADPGSDYGSLTPDEVARLLRGVCRDQHPFLVSVMKEGQGIEGRTIGYVSPDTSHAIAVYRDPRTGRWNVAEYGTIHYTQAASAEEAFERVRPDALVYSDWSGGGPRDKQHQINIRYSRTAREYFRFIQPSLGTR